MKEQKATQPSLSVTLSAFASLRREILNTFTPSPTILCTELRFTPSSTAPKILEFFRMMFWEFTMLIPHPREWWMTTPSIKLISPDASLFEFSNIRAGCWLLCCPMLNNSTFFKIVKPENLTSFPL